MEEKPLISAPMIVLNAMPNFSTIISFVNMSRQFMKELNSNALNVSYFHEKNNYFAKKLFFKIDYTKKMLILFSCLHRWQGIQQEANSEYPHQACAWQNKEFCLSFLFLLCFSGLRFEKTHQKNSQSWIQSRKQRSPTKSPDPTSTSAILTHI